jgi:hypothetical protein
VARDLAEAGRAADFVRAIADARWIEDMEETLNWALAQPHLLCSMLDTTLQSADALVGVLWELATRTHLRPMRDGSVLLPSGERVPCQQAVDAVEMSAYGHLSGFRD